MKEKPQMVLIKSLRNQALEQRQGRRKHKIGEEKGLYGYQTCRTWNKTNMQVKSQISTYHLKLCKD
jgi:hypothetical protein